MGSAVGIWSLLDQRDAAKASERRAEKAMFASAEAAGTAAAREEAERHWTKNGQAKDADSLSLEDATKLSRKKRGVNSTYTAATDGSGAGMMKGTTLSPIGGGDTGAIAG